MAAAMVTVFFRSFYPSNQRAHFRDRNMRVIPANDVTFVPCANWPRDGSFLHTEPALSRLNWPYTVPRLISLTGLGPGGFTPVPSYLEGAF
jgi:hypothetical protein